MSVLTYTYLPYLPCLPCLPIKHMDADLYTEQLILSRQEAILRLRSRLSVWETTGISVLTGYDVAVFDLSPWILKWGETSLSLFLVKWFSSLNMWFWLAFIMCNYSTEWAYRDGWSTMISEYGVFHWYVNNYYISSYHHCSWPWSQIDRSSIYESNPKSDIQCKWFTNIAFYWYSSHAIIIQSIISSLPCPGK